jgi:proteasome lid subunit RPN8/RPN11
VKGERLRRASLKSWQTGVARGIIAMLRLSESLHEQIKAHGARSYPHEGCGLLLGRVEGGVNLVSEIRPMANVWPVEEEKRVRFRIAEDDWRDAEFEAMKADLDVIGVFHSHPDSQPVAYPRDLNWASWPGYSYIITEVSQGKPTHSRSWQLLPDRSGFFEEEIDLIET